MRCGWTAGAAGLALAMLTTTGALAADPLDGPVATGSATGAPLAVEAAPTAQAPVRSSAAKPVPQPAAPGDPTDRQIASWIADDRSGLQAAGPVAAGGQDDFAADAGAAPPRRIHGEVGAGFGSRGYREAYGAVAVPVGQASEVDLAVADAHANFRHGGGGEQRSLAIGVFLDGRDVAGALGRDTCRATRWGVAEKDDPVVNADGSCAAKADSAAR